MNTSCVRYNSAELFFPAVNNFNGIEVEFLNGEFGVICFLSVKCREIPPIQEQPECSSVLFIVEDESRSFHCKRLKGNQRLLLPNDATNYLIKSLNTHPEVKILLEGFCAVIPSEKFSAYYKQFVMTSNLKLRVHP